jgi:hypothetical protein
VDAPCFTAAAAAAGVVGGDGGGIGVCGPNRGGGGGGGGLGGGGDAGRDDVGPPAAPSGEGAVAVAVALDRMVRRNRSLVDPLTGASIELPPRRRLPAAAGQSPALASVDVIDLT